MIALEIVPRKIESFPDEMMPIFARYSKINAINIPDIHRLSLRSYDAALYLAQKGLRVIPHIRATGQPLAQTIDISKKLFQAGIKEILMIQGDPPIAVNAPVFEITSIQAIQAIKAKVPQLKVYAAMDPYRSSFKQELTYCHAKLDSGADGLFSQAFFDVELARMYVEQLENVPIYLGHCPVLNESAHNYWTTRNHVIFPKSFKMDMAINGRIAQELIALAEASNNHVYLMPILAPLNSYLDSIFG